MTEQTVKCKICDKPYKFYMFSAADQSACPACVGAAERAVNRGSSDDELAFRRSYFGNT